MDRFTKASFCLDSLPEQVFEGYSDGDTWNGFACPCFERPVAETLLELSSANGYVSSYDEARDVFIVRSEADPDDYEPEEFAGQVISVGGKNIRVYAIGAYAWTWDRC